VNVINKSMSMVFYLTKIVFLKIQISEWVSVLVSIPVGKWAFVFFCETRETLESYDTSLWLTFRRAAKPL
jgi:hypothetical protein